MYRFLVVLLSLNAYVSIDQADIDPWRVLARDIDASNYYGVTVANGVIGVVSSPEPMKVCDVILNGTFDYYQRGRVSNILKCFNHLNMNLDVDGQRVNPSTITNYEQELDMRSAKLITQFDVCLLYTSPSPRDRTRSRMPSSA